MDDHEEDGDLVPHLSLETVRDYLEEHNGKVRQIDLVNHFRSELNSPGTKTCARQEFKDILQVITAFKIENGEKYIILTKPNQDSFQSSLITRKSKRFRRRSSRQEFINRHKQDFTTQLTSISNIEKALRKDRLDSLQLECSLSQDSSSSQNTNSFEINKRLSKTSIDTTDSGTYSLQSDDEELEVDIGLKNLKTISSLEKDWFLVSSAGNLEKLETLYKECKTLLHSADFIMGYTALHWAAKLNRTDILDFLVSRGASIEARSHGGCTALHVAAVSGKDDAIARLLCLGASKHVRDYGGRKPKDIVKDSVAEQLQRKLGKIITEKPKLVQTPDTTSLQRNSRLRKSSIPFFRQSRISDPDDPDSLQRGLDTLQRSMSLIRNRMASPLSPGRKLSRMQSFDCGGGTGITIDPDTRLRSATDHGHMGETFEMTEYSMVI